MLRCVGDFPQEPVARRLGFALHALILDAPVLAQGDDRGDGQQGQYPVQERRPDTEVSREHPLVGQFRVFVETDEHGHRLAGQVLAHNDARHAVDLA